MTDFLGSNPIVKINGISLERLKAVFSLVHDFPATGFINKDNKLIFMKYDNNPDMIPFPSPMDPEACAIIAKKWVEREKYPKEPDHDGDNVKGWYVWNDNWGRIEGYGYQSFIAIEPMWIMYGK